MKTISEHELEQMYCEMLDDVFGTIKIAGLEYETSCALREVDPIAFRCGFADWLDSAIGETIWEHNGKYVDSDPTESEEQS